MKVFWNKFLVISIQLFLAVSLSSIHAMHAKRQPKRNLLNIEQFLHAIKCNFFITSQNSDFKMLKTVLLQYHPNKCGNITGKNLTRLRQNAKKSLTYWSSDQIYYHMLKELYFAIDTECIPLAVEKNNASDVCGICRDNEQEVITITCKHDFCYECLFEWYVRHKKENDCHHSCPSCRRLFHNQIIANIQRDERYKKIRIKLDEEFAREVQNESSEFYSESDRESDWELDWESGTDEASASRGCFADCILF